MESTIEVTHPETGGRARINPVCFPEFEAVGWRKAEPQSDPTPETLTAGQPAESE